MHLTLALALLSATPSEGTDLIMPSNRKPLAFLLITPSGNVANTSSSDIIRIVSELFAKHTDFQPNIVDPASVSECKGQLGCMVQQVRSDYQRAVYLLPNGTVAPFDEHLEYLKKKKIVYPTYLLVLSNLTLDESDRLSITMIDTDIALEYFHEALRDREGWERSTEARISEYALIGKPIERELKSEAAAQGFLEDWFNTELRRHFSDSGNWEPFGSIEIESTIVGAGISIDGSAIGTTAAGVTRVLNVTAAKHALKFEHPGHDTYETEVAVERGKAAKVRVDLMQRGDPISYAFRQGLLWGGGAIALAGAAAAIAAAVLADGSVKTYCATIEGMETNCGSARFTTTAYKPGRAPTFMDEVNSGSVLFAPLGYSIAVTGLAWSLGTLFLGDDDDFPWIQLVAGVALGGISYGLSALLNPDNPYRN
jgi:hypothetical protein